jgi:ABC-type nitrate/sulfonate/bicarbonate transport system ATPase subunit
MTGLTASGISKSHSLPDGSEHTVLGPLELDIAPAEFVCLLGPSGCGKTTLLNILAGLERRYRGTFRFTAGSGPGSYEVAPVISYMFQEARLLPWLTVRENLRFVLQRRQRGKTADALIDYWLERVGLSGYAGYYPAQLSAGMQQRVSLARALIIEPQVLLMDEPLSSLDELTASRMRDELLSLWMEQRPTVVSVTHNPLEAVYLADRVLIMSAGPGRVIRQLDVASALTRPRDADDAALWRLSRECVRVLANEGGRPREMVPVGKDADEQVDD